ncbi:MAG: PAS domain-containing protein, partial [Proteobacteria bacterium]|nr:PAS domain-containing protein [Pseudomonadota bacterium]
DETYRIFGIPLGTLLKYDGFLSCVHPEDRERVDRAWNAALEGMPYDIEHRIVVDGAVKWLHGRAELEFDPEGTQRSGFGTVQDITERKLSEQALHESEERFRNLADAMPQLVWTANPSGILDYMNRRDSEFQGLRQENGQVVWEHLVHPDDLGRTSRAWAEAVLTGATYEVEHRFHRADGSYAWYLSRAMSFREQDGKIVKWYGTSTDIQEQKRVEAALAEADEAKDRFVAMLAHELRNPLNNVGMALANLRISGSGRDKEQGLFLEVIGQQANTMVSLVNDLLDVARIKRGKICLCRKRVALSCILEEALKSARPLIDERDHTLKVRPPMEPVWLDADPVRIGQIIGNLLNNAAKYTQPGGTITVTAAREADHVVLRVSDTGIGIAPHMLPRVFDLFTQADAEGQHSTGGLGLGLTLVRQLAALHGGTVEAESPGLGAGSVFTLRLPLADESLS